MLSVSTLNSRSPVIRTPTKRTPPIYNNSHVYGSQSHDTATLFRLRYLLYNYMDPLGSRYLVTSRELPPTKLRSLGVSRLICTNSEFWECPNNGSTLGFHNLHHTWTAK